MLDAYKLMWLAATMDPRPRLLLCMSDDEAAKPFLSAKSWRTQALRDVGVDVQVVPLPDDIRRALEMAQVRQAR